MIIRPAVFAIMLLAFSLSARAEGFGLRGAVKGTDGKALAGAEVRAQRLDGKGPVVVGKTDAKGEYSFKGLNDAAYKVTAVVNKVPKSVASVRTRATGWVRVDFDLRATAAKPSRKRMVWVAGETGTHIGGGHWEEVDDTNTGKGASSMERLDGRAVNLPGNGLNPVGGTSGPGH
jgi:Carboxypeptidase regulatory-like domain